jgi:hypothetical protein
VYKTVHAFAQVRKVNCAWPRNLYLPRGRAGERVSFLLSVFVHDVAPGTSLFQLQLYRLRAAQNRQITGQLSSSLTEMLLPIHNKILDNRTPPRTPPDEQKLGICGSWEHAVETIVFI